MTTTVTVLRAGQNTTVGSVSSRTEYQVSATTGLPGVSITAANTASGNLVLTLSNNATIDAGSISATVNTAVNTSAQYVWSNTHEFTANLTIKGVVANGSVGSAGQVLSSNGSSTYWANGASGVSSAELTANLANYQTTAGLSANVATLTSNNTSFVGSISAANVVSNSQLSSNLANYATTSSLSSYQTTAGLSANVATLTSNNASYLGGVAANQYAYANQISTPYRLANSSYYLTLDSNGVVNVPTSFYNTGQVFAATSTTLMLGTSSHYIQIRGSDAALIFPDYTVQTTAFTGSANNASYLGGVAANQYAYANSLTSYQTTAGLSANVATLSSNNASYLGGVAAASYANTSGSYTFTGVHTYNANVAFGSTITISGNAAATFGNTTINGTLTATGNITGNTAGFTIGYLDVPQNYTNTSFTIALSDRGKHIYTSNGTSQTITIANNSSVAFPIGTAISIVSQGAGTITVARDTGVTLYLAANNTSADRTIASYGMATLLKVGTDTWFINGAGVT